jgi:hypothetical protein
VPSLAAAAPQRQFCEPDPADIGCRVQQAVVRMGSGRCGDGPKRMGRMKLVRSACVHESRALGSGRAKRKAVQVAEDAHFAKYLQLKMAKVATWTPGAQHSMSDEGPD